MKFCLKLHFCAAAICLLLCAACSKAPVTGRLQLAFHDPNRPTRPDNALTVMQKGERWDQDRQQMARVQRIARRLKPAVAYYDRYRWAGQWSVHVVTSKRLNAWVNTQGHTLFLTNRLVGMRLSDAELAAVMAHELGHLIANHIDEKLTAIEISALVLGFAPENENGNPIINITEQVIETPVVLFYLFPLERIQEMEADRIGLFILARAGYNPHAMQTLLVKVTRKHSNHQVLAVFTDHPADAARIEQIKKLMPKVMPIYQRFALH